MKLFIKILLFVLVALTANVKVVGATDTFTNIQEVTTSFSFHKEITKSIFKDIENNLGNCCQNGQDLVAYRYWAKFDEATAAMGGSKYLYHHTSREAADNI